MGYCAGTWVGVHSQMRSASSTYKKFTKVPLTVVPTEVSLILTSSSQFEPESWFLSLGCHELASVKSNHRVFEFLLDFY